MADPHHKENSTRDNTDILFSDASSGQKDNSASSTGVLFELVLGFQVV